MCHGASCVQKVQISICADWCSQEICTRRSSLVAREVIWSDLVQHATTCLFIPECLEITWRLTKMALSDSYAGLFSTTKYPVCQSHEMESKPTPC